MSSTGYMVRQKKTVILFLQRRRNLSMRCFFLKWCAHSFLVTSLFSLESDCYHTFYLCCSFITQAETLRDSFPASEKFLSRLLVEVPYLPKSIFEMLECLCSPGSSDNDAKELHCGDRVTQGLSAIWSLVLLRPPIRDSCLRIALKVSFY